MCGRSAGILFSHGRGRLLVMGVIEVSLAHWLSGKLAESHTPHHPFDKLSRWRFVVVHLLSHVWPLWPHKTSAGQASLSFITSRSLLKLMSVESVMPSTHLILYFLLFLLLSIFPSSRVFSSESVLPIRWPKYWSFSISPSNEYSGLISFRMDCFDLLAVHRILKSLLQHHSSKASILRCSAFPIVQLSHPYMTTGKP